MLPCLVLSRPVFPSLVSSCPLLSCPLLSRPVLSRPVLSRPVLSRPLSRPVLSRPVLSRPVLSCPVLSHLVSSHLVSSRPVPSRLVSSRLVPSRLGSSRLGSSRLVPSRLVPSPIASSHIVPSRTASKFYGLCQRKTTDVALARSLPVATAISGLEHDSAATSFQGHLSFSSPAAPGVAIIWQMATLPPPPVGDEMMMDSDFAPNRTIFHSYNAKKVGKVLSSPWR